MKIANLEDLQQYLKSEFKIKSNSLKTRVIYRPDEKKVIYMSVIAIGPRDKEKAYKMAVERLDSFYAFTENSLQ